MSQGTKTDTPRLSRAVPSTYVRLTLKARGSKNSCSLSQLREPAEPSAPVAAMKGDKLKAYPSCLS